MYGKSMIDSLIELLFPARCAGCARLGALLCQSCRAELVPYPAGSHLLPPTLDDARIAFLFQSPLREAVHQFKYQRVRRMAQPLGALLAAHLTAHPLEVDALLPVPLHPDRLAERGFNQAEALASEVARIRQLPLITEGLVRVRMTEQQAHLDARSRQENMRNAFQWCGSTVPPRRVLLVDDILTTGATLNGCAEALRSAGAQVVYGLALARSRRDLPDTSRLIIAAKDERAHDLAAPQQR
jgi:ComF family protein